MNLSSQVILQGFYWDVPVNSEQKEGIWYKNLETQLPYLHKIGITGIWCPPSSKGNWGIYDMGYGIYDHYDLGDMDQIGTRSTRFGTRDDLRSLIDEAHQQQIEIYADVVLNHMYSTQMHDLEPNPVIRYYLQTRNKKQAGYPVNELRYGVKMKANQTLKILVANPVYPGKQCGYRLKISDRPDMSNASQRFHPVTGKNHPYGYWEGLVDEHVQLTYEQPQNPEMTLWLQLEVLDEQLQWSDQTNGLCLYSISDQNGQEVDWELYSFTGIQPKSGRLSWDSKDFHPSSEKDYLLNYPDSGGVVANSKLFGHDFDHANPKVNRLLIDWGRWLIDTVGYDGVRLDFVNGIEGAFIKEWTNKVLDSSQFCVTEFFTFSERQIVDWNRKVNNGNAAEVKSFDFPLKKLLTEMCNDTSESFDMCQLHNAGLIKYLSNDRIVTFAENHDTGKEHDKWIQKDWAMAYAYILFHQPTPCVFYSHLFPTEQHDFHDQRFKVRVGDDLPGQIEKCLKLRSGLTGETEGLRELMSNERYVAYRGLKNLNSGAILIINGRQMADTLLLDGEILQRFKENTLYVDALHPENTVKLKDGSLQLSTAGRGASIWIKEEDYHNLFNKGQ